MKFKYSCYTLLAMLLLIHLPANADEQDALAFEKRCATEMVRNQEPTLALFPSKYPFYYGMLKEYMAAITPDNYDYKLGMLKGCFNNFLEDKIEASYRKENYRGDFAELIFALYSKYEKDDQGSIEYWANDTYSAEKRAKQAEEARKIGLGNPDGSEYTPDPDYMPNNMKVDDSQSTYLLTDRFSDEYKARQAEEIHKLRQGNDDGSEYIPVYEFMPNDNSANFDPTFKY